MRLLNTKSILDCNELEEEKHNQENQDLLSKLSNYPNYDCAAIIKYFDEANKDKEPIIKSCNLHNCDEMINYIDSKNGVDIAIVEDFLTFIVYGQGYFIDNISYQTQTGIQIRPYDFKRDFIFLNISKDIVL
ncbi:hypothetical protein [Holdemanella biformis]|uniref:hypothetical protein n=1 Tax=Holdemanella biformis TaxID=1735 RepID=UPI00307E53EF